ncbi:MAG TPA: hypothetical protein GYA06_13000 [Chloroflexi bacterium]|jgi:hypothetical protein|nr:hypothetical protein [Chloroflexota bacterium]HPO57896.1 hypothetical protein [Anaerolineaceae bacterium]
MNKLSQHVVLASGKMNSQTVRVILFVLSLGLFVIAAGAPECPGGFGG